MEHLSDASPHIQAEATPGATKGADPRDATEPSTHASGADAPTGKCPSILSHSRLAIGAAGICISICINLIIFFISCTTSNPDPFSTWQRRQARGGDQDNEDTRQDTAVSH